MYDFGRVERIQNVPARLFRPDLQLGAHPLNPDTPQALTAETLCERYAERVYRFAAMVARHDIEAEDIAQEALERGIRKLGQFDPRRGTVESWLFRIVTNAARDAGRVSSRRLALWQRLVAQRTDPEAAADDVEVRALARLSDHELLAAVRRLRPRERTVIALRFGADLDHASIGATIGLSPNAARVAVRRALDRLRDQLQEEHQ
jgi:RNA polymerase sigma-70 factor (ECF subfamily)